MQLSPWSFMDKCQERSHDLRQILIDPTATFGCHKTASIAINACQNSVFANDMLQSVHYSSDFNMMNVYIDYTLLFLSEVVDLRLVHFIACH